MKQGKSSVTNNWTTLNISKSVKYAVIAVGCAYITGCASPSSSVIALTGTTIGVELSQNQTNQTPTAVLGYKRSELAYVPTNRATSQKTTTNYANEKKTQTIEEEGVPNSGNGARDSANVLMELRYRGIFSWGENAGIYQRLAVGDIAVTQPGAAFMFSKDDKGSVSADVAEYIAGAQIEITKENKQIKSIISYVADGADAINSETLNALVGKAEKTDASTITTSVANTIKATKTGAELKALLADKLDATIGPLHKNLPTDKQ